MADVEVSYENTLIKSLSASGQAVLHTAGKYCDDDITIDYTAPGGGGGYTVVDSGTFVGNGTSDQTITLGNRVPLKDFYLFVWYDDTDFLYSTEYKIFSFTVFSQGTLNQFVYYDTYGIYTRYASNSTQIDIDNSGVVTSKQAYGVIVETLYARNDTIGVYTKPMAAGSPQIRKSSTGLYFMASVGNGNYHFMNGETYNWKLVYFGNDPTNDFLTL